jgi:hypothetical protein
MCVKRPWAVMLIVLMPVTAALAEEGFVLHYTFDEGAGATVHDRSGHGYDGAIAGPAGQTTLINFIEIQPYLED